MKKGMACLLALVMALDRAMKNQGGAASTMSAGCSFI